MVRLPTNEIAMKKIPRQHPKYFDFILCTVHAQLWEIFDTREYILPLLLVQLLGCSSIFSMKAFTNP